ncbi:mucin-2-like [Culex pipiens pallens]|uniref:mucin-2-like n=1 Tax=Culex pipiens pallens TaxID=42434 RepID=UPI001952FB25|nr:mucin-2-like [Culex pipiens pallens]
MIPNLLLGPLLLCLGKISTTRAELPRSGFSGYNYPKPSIPFNHGYTYTKPSCPLVLPSTSYLTATVTETSVVMTTLPPLTTTEVQLSTSFVTLPRVTEYSTQTQLQTLTLTSTDYLTSTTTEFQIQPTTITSYLTSTYCAPNTYLPPEPPKNTYLPAATPPPPPSNTYLPAQRESNIELTTPNSFLQSFGFAQAGPIKRMTEDIQANGLDSSPSADPLKLDLASDSSELTLTNIGAPPTGSSGNSTLQPPTINIIYLDRAGGGDQQSEQPKAPPADLMNWLLCRFNLVNMTCLN